MIESFFHMMSHSIAAVSSLAGHSPQTAFAAVLCAIMVNLFH